MDKGKISRLILFLLIGLIIVTGRGCDARSKAVGFPTISSVLYYNINSDKPSYPIEFSDSKFYPINFFVNLISMLIIFLFVEFLRNRYIAKELLRIFDRTLFISLIYLVLAISILHGQILPKNFESITQSPQGAGYV